MFSLGTLAIVAGLMFLLGLLFPLFVLIYAVATAKVN